MTKQVLSRKRESHVKNPATYGKFPVCLIRCIHFIQSSLFRFSECFYICIFSEWFVYSNAEQLGIFDISQGGRNGFQGGGAMEH